MSHIAQRSPPRLQLDAPPPDPEEKHDCRNTIIKCLREQISQLKYIVELQKELRMGGPYTRDPRGIEDTIITTIGRIETKVDALYNMVNGLTISVGDLRSEVLGKTGGAPSGHGTSPGTRTKGKDSTNPLLPIRVSTWEEKGEDVETDLWGTERPSISRNDSPKGAAPPSIGITQTKPDQKKSNLEGKNRVSKTSWGGDDVVIPATNYSHWESGPEPKKRGAAFTNLNQWSLGENEPLDNEQEKDDWGPPVNWNSWPHKQPTSGQRKVDWGSNDFPLNGKQPVSEERFVGYYSSDQGGKKPEKPSTNKDIPDSFWGEASIGRDQSDTKRKPSTRGDKASISAQVMKVMNILQQQARVQTHTRTSESVGVDKNKNKNKWAVTVETDHGESNDDGRDSMPGGWPPTQSQSNSQIGAEAKPPVTTDIKPKARIERSGSGVTSGAQKPSNANTNTNNNVNDKKDQKEMNKIPTWDSHRREGAKKGLNWSSIGASSKDWVIDEGKRVGSKNNDEEKDKGKSKSEDKERSKENIQKKSIRPANEIYDTANDTEWASTRPWSDDDVETSDADTTSPDKSGDTW